MGWFKTIQQPFNNVAMLLIKRYSATNTADFIECRDESSNLLFEVASDGRPILHGNTLDFAAVSGVAEWRIISGGSASTVFRIYNAGAGVFQWISTPQAFQIFGSAYTNGSENMQPINFRGYKTTTGVPTTGTWAVNDAVLDGASPRRLWICTSATGSGTWS